MGLLENYYIGKVSYDVAMEIVIKYHYLHRQAPCSFAFGLFLKNGEDRGFFVMDKLVGVVIYGTPSSEPLRKGICGPEERNNVIELTRLWIDDSVPKNGESFLVGNTIKKVDKEIIVSFAEIEQGHLGIIYQATNFIYTGLSMKRTNWTIRGSKKHSHTIADKYTSRELKKLCGDDFTLVDRPRKHRYIYFNCSKKRRKELLNKLRYEIFPYPKKTNNE